MQLLLLGLVFSLTVLPLSIVGAANGRWILGLPLCKLIHTEIAFISQLRSWLMFVFVCDRFCTVFVPFRYPKYRNKIVWSLYATVLIITILSVTFLQTFDCSGLNRISWICSNIINEDCPEITNCNSYNAVEIVVHVIFGSLAPMAMYTALFLKGKKVRNQIVTINTYAQEEIEQRKRNKKVNVTFFTIFLSLVGLTIPPLVVILCDDYILAPLGVEPPQELLTLHYLLHNFYLILPITDSIAILRNPETRKAIETIKTRLTRLYREMFGQENRRDGSN